MEDSPVKKFMIIVCLCGLATAHEKPAVAAPALTIYNQNFFVARGHFPLELKAGGKLINYAGVAAHLEPDSVILRDPAGRALQILEQNYRNDPISQELLLSFYEGKTIDFIVGRLEGKEEIERGKILRSGYVPSGYFAQGDQ